MQWVQVCSLVRELRSHVLHSVAKKKKSYEIAQDKVLTSLSMFS